jgi:lysophospholipase L1-like esterase
MTYPNQLQTMLGSGYKVTNFGAGGRTMLKKGDNPYWTTGPLKQALASKPGIVVLMLGTNDAKFHNWGPLHSEFPIDYTAMINTFKNVSSNPKIYLMVPPPLYQNDRYGMNQTVINSVFPGGGPAGVRTLAKANGLVAPIDLFSLWEAHCPVVGGTPGHAPSNKDVPCDWIASGGTDACHPSNEGYGKLAEAVAARIA